MTTKLDPADGTIEVRVVLYVKVDPKAWAQDMMGEHEVQHREVRAHVKDFIRDVAEDSKNRWAVYSAIDPVPISSVVLESPHPARR